MLVHNQKQALLVRVCPADCHILAKGAEHDLPSTNAAVSPMHRDAVQVLRGPGPQYGQPGSYLPQDLGQTLWLRQIR